MSVLNDLSNETCELEMTPMIDVTFLLLIFFMVTLKFKVLEGKLSAYLPKDVGVNSSQAEPVEKMEVLVRVRTEGTRYGPDGKTLYTAADEAAGRRYVWGPDRKLEYSLGSRVTNKLSELSTLLKNAYDPNAEKQPTTIDARNGTCYGDIVPVLDAMLDANFTDITFVGAYDPNIK